MGPRSASRTLPGATRPSRQPGFREDVFGARRGRDVAVPEGAEAMKVYLDDERATPEGWVPVRWPEEAIGLLEGGQVTELSLDHDLGDDEHGTGYDVLLWLEEAVATRGFVPPRVRVHSANSSARLKMEQAIARIERFVRERGAE
ncbi:cyclic-phosphate processing receiver domain-containing protein [Pyxidicoccus xibeiensis]|uniref:cyclic-phosphate processing receiver domain-containing protein n=1 Tax=Pyxidicoccus xibeiensis TaxID=2906759 RepID=UPI0020A7410E|nr:cyclic-phosphate processing receiver domain-containing protein [Pyxidicoccus xibeiensis]MCP3139621.1 hypothetical protein [Pyxidicoccus xibeiensis]